MPKEFYSIDNFDKGMRTDVSERDVNVPVKDQKGGQRKNPPYYSNALLNLKAISGNYDDNQYGGLLAPFTWGMTDSFDVSQNINYLDYYYQAISRNSPIHSAYFEVTHYNYITSKTETRQIEIIMFVVQSGEEESAVSWLFFLPKWPDKKIDDPEAFLTWSPDQSEETHIFDDLTNQGFTPNNWGIKTPFGTRVEWKCKTLLEGAFEQIHQGTINDYSAEIPDNVQVKEFIDTPDGVRISFGRDYPTLALYFYNKRRIINVTTGNENTTGIEYSQIESNYYLGVSEVEKPPVDWLHRDTQLTNWSYGQAGFDFVHLSGFPSVDSDFAVSDEETITLPGSIDKPCVAFGLPYQGAVDNYEQEVYHETIEGNQLLAHSTELSAALQIGCSWYDTFGQESSITLGRILSTYGPGAFEGNKWEDQEWQLDYDSDGDQPVVDARQIVLKIAGNISETLPDRIEGMRIYTTKRGRASWGLLYDINFSKGEIIYGLDGLVRPLEGDNGKVTNKHSNGYNDFLTTFTGISYEGINRGKPSDIIHPGWNCSTVVNNTLYAGDVRYMEYGHPEYSAIILPQVHSDRVLITRPGKYDAFNKRKFLEVQNKDGVSTTALAHEGDNLFMFRQDSVVVISIAKLNPMVVATEQGKGVDNPSLIVKTPSGMIWANWNGLFLYTDKGVVNLIENKLDKAQWKWFFTGNEDSEVRREIRLVFDEKTNNLMIYRRSESGVDSPTYLGSNFTKAAVTGYNLDMSRYSFTALGITEMPWLEEYSKNLFRRWDNVEGESQNYAIDMADNTLTIKKFGPSVSSVRALIYTSADLDFDSMGQDKKFRWLYIYYKSEQIIRGIDTYVQTDGSQGYGTKVDDESWQPTSELDAMGNSEGEHGIKKISLNGIDSAKTLKITLLRKPIGVGLYQDERHEVSDTFRIMNISLVYRKRMVK